ncbi:vacuolar protein sorting 11 [Actinidia rufa]|uniref:Vacuolar protein sorting 11 n=1 Tax=Actinidia rufa TaxID=165716 RepID=A0A7J0G380_9ERIC|nr:vacuolar protein sorting 11 [Actinidia rufa]
MIHVHGRSPARCTSGGNSSSLRRNSPENARSPTTSPDTSPALRAGGEKIVVGCDDGTVSLLDRGLKFNYGFQAHFSSVLFLQQLKQRNFLVTVGEDEQISLQLSSMCLKVFDLDKVQPEGTSTASPECVQILRIFTNQYPEAKITSFLVLEEAPPILLIAIGLDNGCIYGIKGDIARERIKRFKVEVDNHSNKSQFSVMGMGFRVDGQATQLFAVTPTSVSLFSLQTEPYSRHTLDQIGCHANTVAMSDRSELIIGRDEAVYFFTRLMVVVLVGPLRERRNSLDGFRGYLLCVIADQRSGKNTFNIYDLKNRLIAHSLVIKEVSQMLCEWGNIILIMADKSAFCIGEKDMESKLDMLFKKNLYTVAINLVQSQQADAAATAEVLRKYGDHLYSKQEEYDEAMAQYINTIGHLEPSFVIQKFLDAQRIYNLTNYLEKLHEKGLASKDHTTLLLNCYTKLKDVEKLNVFIKSEDGVGELKFDVETAIRVCRAANYHEHAMYVAKKAGRHEWYLKILLEDLGSYEEALQYISSLEPSQAGVTVKEYGKILIEHKPAETIENTHETLHGGRRTSQEGTHLAQVEIHNTLLELYLSDDLTFPSISQVNLDENNNFRGERPSITTVMPRAKSNGKLSVDQKDLNKGKDCQERLQKGLRLLKTAWPSDLEHPLYDVDLAIILCEMNAFKEGLLYLYEKMKLYKEEETLAMRKEIQDLRTNARIFQLSKCTACTFTLDLPAVHFMCMHSFHLRCLGDNEKECPECAPEYRSVLEMKRSLEQNSKYQDQFFQQVKSSKDGFSVIAEVFWEGNH